MKILGLQKLTLLDFPGRVAAIVFTGGCNFRCPFCQNSSLVLSPEAVPEVTEEEFQQFLRRRRGLLDGICVTGGEPTLHADLPEFLASIRDAGYLVKLDTNGTNPAMLSTLLDRGLLDYVAMDIKAGPDNYARVCGLAAAAEPRRDEGQTDSSPRICGPSGPAEFDCDGGQTDSSPRPGHLDTRTAQLLGHVRDSVNLLMNASVDYEFRTTVVKGLHTDRDFVEIASWLSGCRRYFLQSFRDCPEVLLQGHSFSEFSSEEMQHFLSIVQKEIPQAALRGL